MKRCGMPNVSASPKYNKAREKAFEAELAHLAAINHCAYIKIPDPLVTAMKIQDRKNFMMTECKRPFDAILVTPNGNYCIECKYNYTPLAEHQKENLARINEINDSAWVLRKLEKFDDTGYKRIWVKYRKEKAGEVILETEDPQALIKSFLTKT
jgi:hypothetical protein